jgi:hypothetical protein
VRRPAPRGASGLAAREGEEQSGGANADRVSFFKDRHVYIDIVHNRPVRASKIVNYVLALFRNDPAVLRGNRWIIRSNFIETGSSDRHWILFTQPKLFANIFSFCDKERRCFIQKICPAQKLLGLVRGSHTRRERLDQIRSRRGYFRTGLNLSLAGTLLANEL